MTSPIYWCNQCQVPIIEHSTCPVCGNNCHSVSINGICNPVYLQEKKLLSKIFGQDVCGKNIWYLGSSSYLIDGKRTHIPYNSFFKKKMHLLYADELRANVCNNDHIINERTFIKANETYIKKLIYEAEDYVQQIMGQYKETHMATVSFSGGKDSTVVSRIVRDALQTEAIIHNFGDTTLEFPSTYEYVSKIFRQENPIPPIMPSETDNDFFKLCKVFGPPSKFERWCCTIFKTSNLNSEYGNLATNSLSFLGIRHSESKERKKYSRTQMKSKISSQINAMPIIEWSDFDVWLYIIYKKLKFNLAYKWGYKRVGCWCCPNNSDWSTMLTEIYYPELAKKWKTTLYDFAKKTNKDNIKDYVENGKWKTRRGASGLETKNVTIADTPCNLSERARNIIIKRKISKDIIEFFKPFGQIEIIEKEDAAYITITEKEVTKNGQTIFPKRKVCDLVISWGTNVIKVLPTASTDITLLVNRIKCQMRKYQYCIKCSACDSVCPYGAINTLSEKRYVINDKKCKQNTHECFKCIAKFYNGCITCQVLAGKKNDT